MTFSIKSAIIEEKQILFALLQPFLDELSHFPDQNPDPKDGNGVYLYPDLDAYWKETQRYPYLLHNDDKIAGFALVRLDGTTGKWPIFMSYRSSVVVDWL